MEPLAPAQGLGVRLRIVSTGNGKECVMPCRLHLFRQLIIQDRCAPCELSALLTPNAILVCSIEELKRAQRPAACTLLPAFTLSACAPAACTPLPAPCCLHPAARLT